MVETTRTCAGRNGRESSSFSCALGADAGSTSNKAPAISDFTRMLVLPTKTRDVHTRVFRVTLRLVSMLFSPLCSRLTGVQGAPVRFQTASEKRMYGEDRPVRP